MDGDEIELRVAKALAAVEIRWRADVQDAVDACAQTVREEREAYRALDGAGEKERPALVRACFLAVDRRQAAKTREERISSPAELDRRLRDAERLARIPRWTA